MTTPLISITLPTFCCSGMRLLESRNRATSEAPNQPEQSSEALFARRQCFGVVGPVDRRHTVGVIEASDVRGDERRNGHRDHRTRLAEARGVTGSSDLRAAAGLADG